MGRSHSAKVRWCRRVFRLGRWVVVSLVACHVTSGLSADAEVATADPKQSADALLIVDCLLPAQVHQLGTGITYLAPRRAIKTAASACSIRGGEYVAFDRANLDGALGLSAPPGARGHGGAPPPRRALRT